MSKEARDKQTLALPDVFCDPPRPLAVRDSQADIRRGARARQDFGAQGAGKVVPQEGEPGGGF
jgi:hypothetical protein